MSPPGHPEGGYQGAQLEGAPASRVAPPPVDAAGLVLDGVAVRSGAGRPLPPLTLQLAPGRVLALLGPNGAGKSSLLHALAGEHPLQAGALRLDGRRLDGLPPDERRRRGLALVPQSQQVLPRLDVHDNLRAAGGYLPAPALRDAIADAYATFPELAALRRRSAGTLSGGEQKMLALAQALVGRPRCLLIDELSLALAPQVVERLAGVLRERVRAGLALLLVDQFPAVALALADHVLVLGIGRLRYDGPPGPLRNDPARLRAAYLGDDADGGG